MTDEVRAFLCPECGEPSKSAVHGIAIQNDPEIFPPAEFSLLLCSNNECQEPIVQVREDWGDGFEDDKPVIYLPSKRQLNAAIPAALCDEFEEAQKCFEAKAYRATLVMVRRTLEGTCADQGATKRILAENLRELQAQGKIDGLLAQWADLLRVVGNKGAHFTGEKVSAQDAQDALDFAEALLDHLYVLRARFDAFKARQTKQASP
ncbi:DUF4145 domain-containing protein [Nocardia sp. NPDC056100]|uniref:DUF4145 domain-containing protein n=1 Tax=Nocardia sp. NPDC056100 TaxID=3345712 RepID=UPI0035D66A25